MPNDVADQSSAVPVQSPTDGSDAVKPSYEARGVVGSNPSRRTKFQDKWPEFTEVSLEKPDGFYMTAEEVIAMFPSAVMPIPKSIYVSICEHRKQMENGLPKTTRRTQKKSINSRLNLHAIWKANNCSCYICQKTTPFSDTTRDHVFPKTDGYTLADNMMPACGDCNREKGDTPPTLTQVQNAVTLYESIGRRFAPRKHRRDFVLEILVELGVLK